MSRCAQDHLDILCAFDEEIGADFELVVEGKSIQVSKFVLMTQSSVFKTIILSELQETKEGKASIQDMSFEAMKELVKFMYSGKFVFANLELALETLVTADRYDVQSLMQQCIHLIDSNITNKNQAYKVKPVAELLNIDFLIKKCNFINSKNNRRRRH